MTAITINYTCSNCEHEFDVEVTFGCRARTYGPPENCHDAEPDECEPCSCPECDYGVDLAAASESAAEWADAQRCDDYEAQQREEGW